MENNPNQSQPAKKRTLTRSPGYPVLNLEEAISRAGTIYDKEQKHWAPLASVESHWGYKVGTGGANRVVSSLLKYGLLVQDGQKSNKRYKVSDDAVLLLNAPKGTAQYREAALRCAEAPQIFRELKEHFELDSKWSLPSEETIKTYLLVDRNFNRNSVPDFIRVLKETLDFALDHRGEDVVKDEGDASHKKDSSKEIRVGSFVQWTSQGVDRFPVPQEVKGISDDGEWIFVECTNAGLPMSDVAIAEPPAGASDLPKAPPINPFAKTELKRNDEPEDEISEECAIERCTLDEGPVVLRWPSELSPESVEELEYWVNGVLRRARRKAGLPPS